MHTANGGAASLHFLDCAIPGVRWNGIVAPEGLTICGVCVCRRRRRLWLCNSSMHMMIARQHSLYEHTNNEWMHFYEPILFAAVLRVSPQLRDHRQYFFIHFYSFHTTTEWALRTLHQLIYYKYDYILFERWCVRHNFTSPLLPPFVAAIFEKWIKYMQNEKRERERQMKIMNKILCIQRRVPFIYFFYSIAKQHRQSDAWSHEHCFSCIQHFCFPTCYSLRFITWYHVLLVFHCGC